MIVEILLVILLVVLLTGGWHYSRIDTASPHLRTLIWVLVVLLIVVLVVRIVWMLDISIR